MKNLGKILSVIAGAAYVFFAIYLFLNPLANLAAISWVIALSIFIGAVSSFLRYLSMPTGYRNNWHLVWSILSVIFAVFLVTAGYRILPIVLPQVLAIIILMASSAGLIRALRLRQALRGLGNSLTVLSILGIILGIVLYTHPLGASILASYIISFFFLCGGVIYLLGALDRLGQ